MRQKPTLRFVEPTPDYDPYEHDRTARAKRAMLIVIPDIRDDGTVDETYTVVSTSGNCYTVTPYAEACTCPDVAHNAPENGCKHYQRVAMMLLEGMLPDVGGDPEPYMTDALPSLVSEVLDLKRALSVAPDTELLSLEDVNTLLLPVHSTARSRGYDVSPSA